MKLVEALHEVAQRQPNTIGLKYPVCNQGVQYRTKTFQELDHEVDLLATYLLMRQITAGKKIVLLLPPGESLLITVFALLRLGAIPVVIDPGMGFKNFFHCVCRVQPYGLIGCQRARLLYYLIRPCIHFSSVVFLSKSLKKRLLTHDFACHLQPNADDNRTAAVLFTSGSTGHPKGAVYTYAAFNAQMEALIHAFGIQPGEVDLPLLPVFSLYNPAMGLTTVVPEMDPAHPSTLNPAKIAQSIIANQVTHSFGSPRLWTKIVDYCEAQHLQFPSIKRLFLAGAPVHPTLLQRAQALVPNGQVLTPYGATEALPIAYISATEVIQNTYQRTIQGHGTCVGYPMPNIQVRIIPITQSAFEVLPESLPIGTIGEITVTAPYISQSYLNDPEATQKAKVRDASGRIWHRMGDAGYMDTEGRLWFCGRKIERVVTDTQTFYTDCCETIFNTHPRVFRTALIAYKTKNGIQPAIVVELKPGIAKSELPFIFKELRTLAKQHSVTESIRHFGYYPVFPVDVRHNAKIHRLTLQHYFAKHSRRIHALD